MVKTASKANEDKATSVYSQIFIAELDERGILEQQFECDGVDEAMPSNGSEILDAIAADREEDEPTNADYEEYIDSVLAVANEAGMRAEVYPLFVGIKTKLKKPHFRAHDEV